MPRLSQQIVARPVALVQRLAELHSGVQGAKRAALDYARQAGEVLLTVPPEERATLAAAAGITGRRPRFVYVQIAEHWTAVQRAGSIREAIRLVKNPQPSRPVDIRDVPLPFDTRCVNDTHRGLPIGECAGTTRTKVG